MLEGEDREKTDCPTPRRMGIQVASLTIAVALMASRCKLQIAGLANQRCASLIGQLNALVGAVKVHHLENRLDVEERSRGAEYYILRYPVFRLQQATRIRIHLC
jgi:hypothetical protein